MHMGEICVLQYLMCHTGGFKTTTLLFCFSSLDKKDAHFLIFLDHFVLTLLHCEVDLLTLKGWAVRTLLRQEPGPMLVLL